MGTIPTIPTFSAGAVLTAAQLNQVKAAIDFWALAPRCYVHQQTAQSIPNNTWTLITFNTEVYDIVQDGDDGQHSNTVNNSRIVIRTSGKYEISGQLQFVANTTGQRSASIRLNSGGSDTGGTLVSYNSQAPVSGVSTSVLLPVVELPLNAGDYVEMFGNQNSGGALNLVAGPGVSFMRIRLTAT